MSAAPARWCGRCSTHARKRRLLEWDPWEAVEPEPTTDDGINPDLVMSPAQLRALAAACASVDSRYAAFVLTQGLCGLRPGEAQALRRRDLHLTATPATVVARATQSAVPDKYFLEGEGRRRPLKGRSVHSSRTIPVPGELASVLRRHLDRWAQSDPSGVVFTNTQAGRIDLSNFQRDVWNAARHATFPASSPLRRVRLHDLRHAAITGWLNAGVPLKTAQAWSGHNSGDFHPGSSRPCRAFHRGRGDGVGPVPSESPVRARRLPSDHSPPPHHFLFVERSCGACGSSGSCRLSSLRLNAGP